MPTGVYTRTGHKPYKKAKKYAYKSEETRNSAKQNMIRNSADWFTSEKHRELGRSLGKKFGKLLGKIHITKYNNSEAGKKNIQLNLIGYTNSEKGKEYHRQLIIKRNKSDTARETSRRIGPKNLAKMKAQKLTPSQLMLCKSLTDNGIHNKPEWYFPQIHRIGDIAIPSSKLIIEVDGRSHQGGMFCTKEEKQADDKLKEDQIKSLGWNVIRFKNEEVNKDLNNVLQKIKEICNA